MSRIPGPVQKSLCCETATAGKIYIGQPGTTLKNLNLTNEFGWTFAAESVVMVAVVYHDSWTKQKFIDGTFDFIEYISA